jgi:hypothetical protein
MERTVVPRSDRAFVVNGSNGPAELSAQSAGSRWQQLLQAAHRWLPFIAATSPATTGTVTVLDAAQL